MNVYLGFVKHFGCANTEVLVGVSEVCDRWSRNVDVSASGGARAANGAARATKDVANSFLRQPNYRRESECIYEDWATNGPGGCLASPKWF